MNLSKATIIRAAISIIISLFIGYTYHIMFSAPVGFPVGRNFVVEENESLRSVSLHLEREHYIDSALLFRAWVSFIGRDRQIQLGEYFFDEAYTLGGVIKKITSGNPDMPLIRVTIPEGSTTHEVAVLVNGVLPTININTFGLVVEALKAEGKLFPSTYFLLPSMNEVKVVEKMRRTFEKKYLGAFDSVVAPVELKSQNEIVSLAAILEGEAKTEEDMKIVAGILLKRLRLGMPLQVDAAPETYKTKGLPKKPINNPGLVSLNAVFHFIDTPYLYYLTGKDGKMYYAKTFEEHKRNIRKYLK